MNFVGRISSVVRRFMRTVAGSLYKISGKRLTPNTVTIIGVIMHLPIAVFIAVGWWLPAAILLVVFGLFDTLDGELARMTKKASAVGMILDSSTDRLKETLLYTGVVYWFAAQSLTYNALGAGLASLALGASICVSYVKARGEIAVATTDKKRRYDHDTLNKKVFAPGLFPFEVRMALLAAGLFVGAFWQPSLVMLVIVSVITVGSLATFVQRLINIKKHL